MEIDMPLPESVIRQDHLLTVNVHEEPLLPSDLPGVSVIPLFLDPENGIWVLYARFEPGTNLPTHYHTGTVHFLTTKGVWYYAEHPDEPQTAGTYLYEPGGSIHTFTVPDSATEAAEGLMLVNGSNVNFEDDTYHSIMDAASIEATVLAAVTAGVVEMPRYIRPPRGVGYAVKPE